MDTKNSRYFRSNERLKSNEFEDSAFLQLIFWFSLPNFTKQIKVPTTKFVSWFFVNLVCDNTKVCRDKSMS